MRKMTSAEETLIRGKYHASDYDPFQPWLSSGWEYDPATGLADEDIRRGLEAAFADRRDTPHALLKARAFSYVLTNTRLRVDPGDWFPGISCWHKDIRYAMLDNWSNEVWQRLPEEQRQAVERLRRCGAIDMWIDFDHSVPDWDALVTLGFPGLLERVKEIRREKEPLSSELAAFYDSVEVAYEAMLTLLSRLEALADACPGEKASAMSASFRRLREGAPGCVLDVLEMIYLYFIAGEYVGCLQVRSLGGGLDGLLQPFYEADLAAGRLTREDLITLLQFFFLQISAIGNYWNHPFYLGGTDETGATRVNEVSGLILEAYDGLEIFNPKIQIKVAENTPRDFLEQALDMVRRKNASIVFVGEPYIIASRMAMGCTEGEALNADIKGCYEIAVRGEEVSTAPLYINLAKPLEMALFRGRDAGDGTYLGPDTGEDFPAFDDFYAAYLTQLRSLLEELLPIVDEVERGLAFINPTPLYTGTLRRALEKGEDGYATGTKYCNTALIIGSLASAVDGLLSLRRLVYEDGAVTLSQLRALCRDNWAGGEILRERVKKDPRKYGVGDPIADRYAAGIADFVAGYLNMRPNSRGGVYKTDFHSARMFLNWAPLTAASPDGRLRGEELSKNLSPSPGMDREGATALILSATASNVALHTEGSCLDVMLHPTAVKGEEGMAALRSLLMAYVRRGGSGLQFNIFNADDLREAQWHPEKYRTLQVRICGWNAYFVDLPKIEQDAFILRADHITGGK
ncbi:MAG: pyruvate formate lyase family protein [Christensenellales bacterium]